MSLSTGHKMLLLCVGFVVGCSALLSLIVFLMSGTRVPAAPTCRELADSPRLWRCDARSTCSADGELWSCSCGKCERAPAATSGFRGSP